MVNRQGWVGHFGPDAAWGCTTPEHWESNIQLHTCTNPDCGARVDSDHVPFKCPVCGEERDERNTTCGRPKCEKFMGEYEFDLL